MGSPRVTTIVPTFNAAKYLSGTIESILKQDFSDLEILVLDDGSTDGTRRALEPYASKIRYEYQENRGIGFTRNRGLQLARGEYVAFLDADDLWDPDHLAWKVAALDQNPDLAAVFGEFRIIDSAGDVVTTEGTTMQFKVFERHTMTIDQAFGGRTEVTVRDRAMPFCVGNIFDVMFLGNFVLPTSLVLRREAALANGPFTSMRTQEDYEYLLRFTRRHPVGFTPEPLVSYRRHPEQLTSFERIESILVAVNHILSRYEDEFTRTGRGKVFNKRMADLCKTLGAVYIRQGRARAARTVVSEGIRRAPGEWRGYAQYALSFVPHQVMATIRRW